MIHVKPRTLLAALACGLATLTAAFGAAAQERAQSLAAIQLTAGFHLIRAEVARRPDERAIGLMHRPSMPANDGMLFVFDAPDRQCFWMKNTLLPLAIAFLADDGRIVNIEEMKPQSLDSHCSAKPVRYALEMNAGWFAKKGIKPGSRITGGPFGKP
jgi:uncharacterized membrane protein (UPF0127 family)